MADRCPFAVLKAAQKYGEYRGDSEDLRLPAAMGSGRDPRSVLGASGHTAGLSVRSSVSASPRFRLKPARAGLNMGLKPTESGFAPFVWVTFPNLVGYICLAINPLQRRIHKLDHCRVLSRKRRFVLIIDEHLS